MTHHMAVLGPSPQRTMLDLEALWACVTRLRMRSFTLLSCKIGLGSAVVLPTVISWHLGGKPCHAARKTFLRDEGETPTVCYMITPCTPLWVHTLPLLTVSERKSYYMAVDTILPVVSV